MKNLAIIPGKRNSRRLPGKNTRLFGGRPIIEWTLEAAKDSNCFDKILIYSDIEEWVEKYVKADVAYGFLGGMASNEFTVAQVCEFVLKNLLYEGWDNFCCLLVTSPLRTTEDIRKSYELYLGGGYQGVIGATKFLQPWWQAFGFSDHTGEAIRQFPDLCDLREERVSKRVTDNGAVYWASVGHFLEQKTFLLKQLGLYEMPFERSIDIDTEVDFRMAEFFYKKFYKDFRESII